MAQFESDWATVYRRIRADDPGALIAGPNTSYYDPTVMADFLAYAKANNVLPDMITWHELSPSSLQNYPANYASAVALEKQDGIGPLWQPVLLRAEHRQDHGSSGGAPLTAAGSADSARVRRPSHQNSVPITMKISTGVSSVHR